MEEIENTQNFTAEQKSSIKVTKNSKGYNWEIRVYDEDVDKALTKTIELDTVCKVKFGSTELSP